MPLYEYKCLQCNRHTEKIQKFSDPEITTCPHCGGTLERVITAPAVSFKGGGWYADGYGNAKPAASSESKTALPATESKTSAETSSTPAPAAAAPAASTPASAAAPSTPSK